MTDSNNTQKKSTRCASYLDLFRCASRTDKLCIYFGLFFSMIAGCTTPTDSYVFGLLLKSISDYGKATNVTAQDDAILLKALIQFFISEFLIGFVLILMTYGSTVLLNISAFNQIYRLRLEYFKAAVNQDFEYYDTKQSGDFAVKMNADMIKLEDGIGEKLALFFFSLASFVSAVLVALYLGWKLALLCLISLPVTVALFTVSGVVSSRLSKKEAAVSGKAGAIAEEVLSGIRTVYAFSGQQIELERYKTHLKNSRKINIRRGFFNGLFMGFLFFSISSAYALSMWFSYKLMVKEPGTYDVATVTAIFLGVMVGSESFSVSVTLMEIFGIATGAGAQIFQLLDKVPKINPRLDIGIKPTTVNGDIELKDVYFKYPSRNELPVLNGINLKVKQGQSIALVGQSGSGKSTVIQLISRYYDVTSGSVIVDGHDVKDLSVRWLRQQIGLVGQEPVLFNTTVRENIGYGRCDATDADILSASEQAHAHKFIVKLPNGYDTVVGEKGASLSGGQKQRIAIARALVRNPSILLLDEATSALDTSSEAKVQRTLDKAKIGRTTIIVAHRLSTIRHVDVIYVIKKGVIHEQGTHEELMAMKGLYHDMVQTQAVNTSASTTDFTKLLARESSVNAIDEDESGYLETVPRKTEDAKETHKVPFWKVLMLNRPEWKSITMGTICSLASGFAMPAFCIIIGSYLGILSKPDKENIRNEIIRYSILFVLIGIVSGILNFFIVYMYIRAGEQLTERLRRLMFEKFLQQEVAFYDDKDNSTGALCAKLSGEAALVQGATGQRVGTILGAVGTFVISLAVSLYYEWRVGLIALMFIPLLVLMIIKEERMTQDKNLGPAAIMEKSSKVAVEAISNVRTVASLGNEDHFVKLYDDQLLPGLNEAKRTAHMRGFVFGLSRGLFNMIMAVALYYGGTLIINEKLNLESVVIASQALLFGSTSAAQVLAFAPNFNKGIKAAARIILLLRRQSTITDPEKPEVENFQGSGEANYSKVDFKYPTRPTTRVLKSFDLKIEKGKTVALVGQSGSGKSTVIQLLERYYDPTAGIVSVDNISLKRLRLKDVRQTMSQVQQEPVLFDRTVYENIAYGDNTRFPNMTEVIEVAKQANIHEFIMTLPQGYNTNIGAKGVQLSGGQKQRIAIARALLRKPKILLLDEATSALDTESEKIVQEALDRAKAGRTCIMIAHRLSTVQDADIICVVQSGRIAESGTHMELLNLNGLYCELNAQEL